MTGDVASTATDSMSGSNTAMATEAKQQSSSQIAQEGCQQSGEPEHQPVQAEVSQGVIHESTSSDTDSVNAEEDSGNDGANFPCPNTVLNPQGLQPMSKSAMKKAAKQARLQAIKAERKLADKTRKKARKAELRSTRDAAMQAMTEEERAAVKQQAQAKRAARKQGSQERHNKLKASLAEGNQRIVIDLDFEGLMPESDQRHLIQQLSYSYHANASTAQPCHLQLLGLHGSLASLADKSLPSMAQWHVTRSEQTWQEFYKQNLQQVVYLTADSPDEIDELDVTKVYIIGGLVDHNRYKGLCYQRAQQAGVATARLPIQKHVKLDSSTVLTVNHVVQILVEWMNQRDWAQVLDKVLPKRKRADWKIEKRKAAESKQDHDDEQPSKAPRFDAPAEQQVAADKQT